MAHVRERPSLRESLVIETPSGKRYRWAQDEHRPEDVPSGDTWSDTMPGGYENHATTLPRDPSVDYDDLERLSTITRYDAAENIIWQGRLERAPRVSGDQVAISPSAVGWQAHLEDDQSVQFIGRDIALTRFGGMSVQRRTNLIAGGRRVEGEPSVTTDTATGNPALATIIQGAWAAGSNPIAEALYDAGPGIDIDSLYYAWRRINASSADANWTWEAALGTDDTFASADTTGNLRAAGPGTGTLNATTSRRCARVQFFYTTGAGTDATFEVDWTALIVYGETGLTKRGTEPDAGFYDGDLIGYAISTWCPLLSYTSDTLASSGFVIPQAAFREPTTVGEVVRQCTRFELRDWAVWDDKTFWLHNRGARGRSWRARVGPARLEETGPQVDRLWNSIMVAYQASDGTTRTVGPVGSGADTESSFLEDTDGENPANRLGIIRRDMLTMGVGTSDSAIRVGRTFLEQANLLDSSGRAVFIGYVEDDRGVMHPYSHVHAGDTVTFVDAADTSPRRIIKTDKNRADRSCSIDIDAPPEGLQGLLERLGVRLVPAGG